MRTHLDGGYQTTLDFIRGDEDTGGDTAGEIYINDKFLHFAISLPVE